MARLTEAARRNLSPDQFVFPKKRRYPIEDRKHAEVAEAYAEGTKDEAAVDRAVHAKYPDLGK